MTATITHSQDAKATLTSAGHPHMVDTGSETKAAIRKWMTFYNHQGRHSALDGKPPALVYWQRNDINQPDQQVQRVA